MDHFSYLGFHNVFVFQTFLLWLANGIFHSAILFWIPLLAFNSGKSSNSPNTLITNMPTLLWVVTAIRASPAIRYPGFDSPSALPFVLGPQRANCPSITECRLNPFPFFTIIAFLVMALKTQFNYPWLQLGWFWGTYASETSWRNVYWGNSWTRLSRALGCNMSYFARTLVSAFVCDWYLCPVSWISSPSLFFYRYCLLRWQDVQSTGRRQHYLQRKSIFMHILNLEGLFLFVLKPAGFKRRKVSDVPQRR